MYRIKNTHRCLAAFLAINTLLQIMFPAVSYALTAGPTAPEFSSFEPVDTTDMVNLTTGDFNYNIPLLEVPGPEGGYPLSLSYHAGISPAEEASWVGLGWSLNPGAINRSVNGYPDDSYRMKENIVDYWDGGETYQKSFGLGYSIPFSGVSINYGIVTSNDTYSGFSTLGTVSMGKGNFYMGKSLGTGAYKDKGKIFIGYKARYRFSDTPLGVDIASMEASMNTKGSSYSYSYGSNYYNSETQDGGLAQSRTKNLSSSYGYIPGLNVDISLQKNHIRYWSDASTNIYGTGILHAKEANSQIDEDYMDPNHTTLHSFSSDALLIYDVDSQNESDPNKQLGGSLPAYDNYVVLGQGVGGSIKPYIFENGDLFTQTIYKRFEEGILKGQIDFDNPEVDFKSARPFAKTKVDYRFVNDFSNKLIVDPARIDLANMTAPLHSVETEGGFNNSYGKQHLAGSSHIEWFTNEEIANGQAPNFIDYFEPNQRELSYSLYEDYLQPEMVLPYRCFDDLLGFDVGGFKQDQYPFLKKENSEEGNTIEYDASLQTYIYTNCDKPTIKSLKTETIDISKSVGGYMITNPSGVTYHYALPVYAHSEYSRTKVKDPEKGASTFRETKRKAPYAYTWLLTAVTGPDYQDRNHNGKVDDEDWGYWVKFDYGKWADNYQWRSPHQGYHSDVESDVETFSSGIKELYYLDAIETKTHKALFIKSMRKDGFGVTSRLEGGSNPRKFNVPVMRKSDMKGFLEFSVSPVATLKLDEIYLFKKEALSDLSINKSSGTKYAASSNVRDYYYAGDAIVNSDGGYDTYPISESNYVSVKYHNEELVLDDGDVQLMKDELKARALKVIEFQTDYSLGDDPGERGVPNSFATIEDIPELKNGCNITDDEILNMIYPYSGNPDANCGIENFCSVVDDFGMNPKEVFDFYGANPFLEYFNTGGNCWDAEEEFKGNKLQFYRLGKLTLKALKVLGKGGASIIPRTVFNYEKNPYSRPDAMDSWQSYKSDMNWENGRVSTKRTTSISKNDVDAWSLSRVITPLGASIKIDYESDDYNKSVLNPKIVLPVKSVSRVGRSRVRIDLFDHDLDFHRYFNGGDKLDFKYFCNYLGTPTR
jgi:hypothetical protein